MRGWSCRRSGCRPLSQQETERQSFSSTTDKSKSVFEKYCEYKAKGGKDSLDKYLADRNLDNTEEILNDIMKYEKLDDLEI